MVVGWLRSTGYTTAPGGKQTPTYAASVPVGANVQALTGRDLEHRDMQGITGVLRGVYLFGNVQSVVRPDAKGGDLLTFPQDRGGTPQTWKVAAVLETWSVEAGGWCKVGVVLQVNP